MSESSTLAGLVTMSFVLGQTFGTFITNWVPPKIWLIGCTYVGTGILTAVAADPLNKSLTIGLLATGACCIGAGEGVAMAMTTFPLRSQEEIGTAGGIAGAIRLTGSSIAVAMYSTILSNRLSVTIPSQVTPIMTDAGLSASSMETVLTTLLNNAPFNENTAPGLTNITVQLIESANRVASAQAYRTVFLSTLGFGAVALVVCWFTGGVDESQGNYVATSIFRADEKVTRQEGSHDV